MIPIPIPGIAGFLPGCAAAVSEKGREETPGQRVTGQHPKVPNSHHSSRVTLEEPKPWEMGEDFPTGS